MGLIASGGITVNLMGSGAVDGANIASGSIVTSKVASGGLGSGAIGSGQIGVNHLISGLTRNYSGGITSGIVGDNAIVAGSIASGQVNWYHLTSGQFRYIQMVTIDNISGFKAVSITSGNLLTLAMAGSGLRLPAIGVVASNFVSGATAQVILDSLVMTTSGLDVFWSGQVGKHLYVGSGGCIVAQGLMVSGQSWQRIGISTSGGILIGIDRAITSGGLVGPAGTY